MTPKFLVFNMFMYLQKIQNWTFHGSFTMIICFILTKENNLHKKTAGIWLPAVMSLAL